MAPTGNSLAGLTVAITGAGGGLGRAYAQAAAEAGANLVIADIDGSAADSVAAEITATGGSAVAVTADIAVHGTGERITAAAIGAFGRLDGFVANAGVLSPGALLEQSEDTVRRVVGVNVDGTIATVTAAARAMTRGGSIVVIISGSLLGADRLALYGTTKAAALGLVYGLAAELRDSGIRVNGLAPRARTAMSAEMGATSEDKGGPPSGIAPVVTYLLGDSSRQLHGHVLRFDGTRLGLLRPPRIEHEVSADAWDVAAVAAAVTGPLADEVRVATPDAARRTGDGASDLLHVDTRIRANAWAEMG